MSVHVFFIECATPFAFDLDIQSATVKTLMEAVFEYTRIPVNQQLLLASGDRPRVLSSKETILSLSIHGSERHPIYLIRLGTENGTAFPPPTFPAVNSSIQEAQDAVDAAAQLAPPSTFGEISDRILGQQRLASILFNACDQLRSVFLRLGEDVRSHQSGLEAVWQYIGLQLKKLQPSIVQFEDGYNSQRDRHQKLLDALPDVVRLLESISIPSTMIPSIDASPSNSLQLRQSAQQARTLIDYVDMERINQVYATCRNSQGTFDAEVQKMMAWWRECNTLLGTPPAPLSSHLSKLMTEEELESLFDQLRSLIAVIRRDHGSQPLTDPNVSVVVHDNNKEHLRQMMGYLEHLLSAYSALKNLLLDQLPGTWDSLQRANTIMDIRTKIDTMLKFFPDARDKKSLNFAIIRGTFLIPVPFGQKLLEICFRRAVAELYTQARSGTRELLDKVRRAIAKGVSDADASIVLDGALGSSSSGSSSGELERSNTGLAATRDLASSSGAATARSTLQLRGKQSSDSMNLLLMPIKGFDPNLPFAEMLRDTNQLELPALGKAEFDQLRTFFVGWADTLASGIPSSPRSKSSLYVRSLVETVILKDLDALVDRYDGLIAAIDTAIKRIETGSKIEVLDSANGLNTNEANGRIQELEGQVRQFTLFLAEIRRLGAVGGGGAAPSSGSASIVAESELRSQLQSASALETGLRAQLAAAISVETGLRVQLATFMSNESDLKAQLDTAATTEKDVRAQLMAAATLESELRSQLAVAAKTEQEVRRQLSVDAATEADLRAQIAVAGATETSLREQMAKAADAHRENNDRMLADLQEQSQQKAELQQVLETTQSTLLSTQSDCQTLRQELENLRKQLDSATADRHQAQQELAAQTQTATNAALEHSAALASLGAAHEAALAQVRAEHEAIAARGRTVLGSLNAEVANLKSSLDTQADQYSALQVAHVELTSRYEQVWRDNTTAQQARDAATSELEQLKSTLAAKADENALLQQQLADATRQLDAQSDTAKLLAQDREDLNQRLVRAQEELAGLQAAARVQEAAALAFADERKASGEKAQKLQSQIVELQQAQQATAMEMVAAKTKADQRVQALSQALEQLFALAHADREAGGDAAPSARVLEASAVKQLPEALQTTLGDLEACIIRMQSALVTDKTLLDKDRELISQLRHLVQGKNLQPDDLANLASMVRALEPAFTHIQLVARSVLQHSPAEIPSTGLNVALPTCSASAPVEEVFRNVAAWSGILQKLNLAVLSVKTDSIFQHLNQMMEKESESFARGADVIAVQNFSPGSAVVCFPNADKSKWCVLHLSDGVFVRDYFVSQECCRELRLQDTSKKELYAARVLAIRPKPDPKKTAYEVDIEAM
ncbi:hypothetical protein CAOG_06453 [Capsaspora owczarzaki ATCC 30864]|uniref:Ubiquitin-like domain-containing protein n=1 Tax=Capsaspora owczarzaki (strain ATCC 30864) TaxID=595528 RepID=A0A0D2ULX5_CAPO3|nr:hypothetical protein CAOG_06453 [Capsaspora owczarzaki ATCC 30864]KJE96081.1 hypothetical protein CAOG_006453 [Capsaspora owczarzaki ATCC 30864]|eukprot:XP_004345202.1 hypothetical protein CAOG_06453 [Capsaspora owczarzaki ATCC 30864]